MGRPVSETTPEHPMSRIVMLTGDDLQHHYVANRIAELIGLEAIVVEKGRPIGARQRLRQLRKRYNVSQLVSRTMLLAVAFAGRDGERRRREILGVLGPSAERFSDPKLVHHVHGLNTPEARQLIASFSPDILVIFGTGIVGDTTLAIARQLALNLHTGISPHYRGSDCVFWSIHNKDYDLVGSTIHECTAEIDGGEIFARGVADVRPDDGRFAIFARCVEVGADLYVSVLRKATAGELSGEGQDLTVGREYRVTDKRLRHELAVRWRFATAGVRRDLTGGGRPSIVYSDWNVSRAGDRNDDGDAPSVSVTIVNHSAREQLRECLGSLEQHPYTKGRMEVVVLDNASDDGSVEMLHTDFPSVLVIAADKRRGYGANQNLAVAASHGDLIFMLNPDAIVHERTIDRLAVAMEWAPGVGAAGGPIANADGTIRQQGPHRFHTPWAPLARALGLSRLGLSPRTGSALTAAGWPSGAACLVRRDVLDELGGFDESFFMYSEDADLFARMVERGYLVAWVADAVVSHPFPIESVPISTRREAEKVKSELRYIRKHFGRRGAAVYRLGIAAEALAHVVFLSMPWVNRVVQRHGRSVLNIRHSHADRFRHALSGAGAPGLAELASDWNQRHHQAPPDQVESGRLGRPPYFGEKDFWLGESERRVVKEEIRGSLSEDLNLRKSRVLLIIENNSVPFDRRVWQEAEALRDVGHEVTVICPRTPQAPRFRETLEGIRIRRYPRMVEAERSWQYAIEYGNATFWQVVLTLGVLSTHGVDVLHIGNPPDTAFVVGGLLRMMGTRVVFDQHDLSPEIYEAKFGTRGLVWRALLICERASYRVAHIVITSNESMRRTAIQRGGRRPEEVFVVRNGPRLDVARRATAMETLKRGRPYLVSYMGIIAAQEGLDGLLRVIDDIVNGRGRTDVQFVIVGDGTGLAALKDEASSRGLDDFVTFTGYLTGDMFWAALNTADVCVSPDPGTTLNDRSTLVKTMDYMALAKPVVQYDLTEARFTSGDTAMYAAPDDEGDLADKILYLLDHPELRRDLGNRAFQRFQTVLAWHHQVPHLITAYGAALNGRP